MSNIDNLFNSDEIETLKASGSTGSKTVKTGAKANKPKALKIVQGDKSVSGGWAAEPAPRLSPTPMRRVTRPNVPGSGEFVRQTNLSRFNAQDAARKKAMAEAELQRKESQASQSPDVMQSRIEYLERSLKKLQREIKVQKEADTDG